MYTYLKRLFDIVISCLLLLLLLPLLIIVGISIKLDSNGPAIIKQRRVGQYGVVFNMFKFRTMRWDTPFLPTSELGDPSAYITRVGHFLRRSSLDELPQLINIVRGDMVFIGPRPVLDNEENLIKLRRKARVEEIKPGLTGYAQINGRDLISDKQKVIYDKLYLVHRCFRLDIKILFKTFLYVLKSKDIRS